MDHFVLFDIDPFDLYF